MYKCVEKDSLISGELSALTQRSLSLELHQRILDKISEKKVEGSKSEKKL